MKQLSGWSVTTLYSTMTAATLIAYSHEGGYAPKGFAKYEGASGIWWAVSVTVSMTSTMAAGLVGSGGSAGHQRCERQHFSMAGEVLMLTGCVGACSINIPSV